MTSTIKVDNIQKVSDGSSIIKKCGSTITVGSCGATVALASGASQTGFGTPSSSVLWCTTAKTSPFTAADKVGYFVNTTGGTITVTLPSSPSAGDVLALKDYANTWDTNGVTLCRNGSKINGVCANTNLSTESQSVTLIYVDGTKGWQDIQDSTSNVSGNAFIAATGGTITCSGNDRIHTFTSSGTFTVTATAVSPANNAVAYMVVAGGGYGSNYRSGSAGGGGAGGFREGTTAPVVPYTASPLVAPAGITVSAQGYPITVGAGSASGATNGTPSIFGPITSTGGGRGAVSGGDTGGPNCGAPGGSGGAADGEGKSEGNGNTPPVSPSQGNNGGGGRAIGGCRAGGGGGGASAAGGAGSSPQTGGAGGAGVSTEITGSAVTRAGGGGGNGQTPGGTAGAGGAGGGGAGRDSDDAGIPGTANTGGGGGAGNKTGCNTCGGQGGSGIVVIRYKFK